MRRHFSNLTIMSNETCEAIAELSASATAPAQIIGAAHATVVLTCSEMSDSDVVHNGRAHVGLGKWTRV